MCQKASQQLFATLKSQAEWEHCIKARVRQVDRHGGGETDPWQECDDAVQTAVAASPRRQEMSKQTLQWWERQIALLAERACAGGRVTELEQQSAALQQQLDALQGEPPVGSVLPGSLCSAGASAAAGRLQGRKGGGVASGVIPMERSVQVRERWRPGRRNGSG